MAETMALLPMLRRTPLFSRITSRADMSQLERISGLRQVAPGSLLVTQGRPVEDIVLICRGEVSVCFSGGTVESLRLGRGSLFGELEFFQRTLGTATVVATAPSELICIPYEALRAIVEDNPLTGVQLYYGFLTAMAGKHQLVTDSLVDIKLDSSRQHLAHDLRSPLVALRLLVDNAALPGDQLCLLCHVVDRIEAIIAGLHTPSELAAANRATRGALLVELHRLVEEKRLRLSCRGGVGLKTSLPVTLQHFDAGPYRSALLRIVSNFIDNSIEATVGRRGRITLHVWERAEVFGIDVRDTGVGMPAELVARLGSEPVTCGKASGQGLGLFQAYRLVHSWGGEVVVKSTPARGS
ncbi:MAG: cyclic nucleotide-binding domain-containing protein, partial [Deltaproteobacteria bacterium]